MHIWYCPPRYQEVSASNIFVANNDGSILFSCKTTLALHLIQLQSRLDYLLPWASLITSTMDHPKKTKLTSLKVHWSKQDLSAQRLESQSQTTSSASRNVVHKSNPNIVITSKEQILSNYPDMFEGIGRFPSLLYHIQVNPNITLKQTPCWPVPIHLKEAFKLRNREDTSSRYYQAN